MISAESRRLRSHRRCVVNCLSIHRNTYPSWGRLLEALRYKRRRNRSRNRYSVRWLRKGGGNFIQSVITPNDNGHVRLWTAIDSDVDSWSRRTGMHFQPTLIFVQPSYQKRQKKNVQAICPCYNHARAVTSMYVLCTSASNLCPHSTLLLVFEPYTKWLKDSYCSWRQLRGNRTEFIFYGSPKKGA